MAFTSTKNVKTPDVQNVHAKVNIEVVVLGSREVL